MKQHRKLYLCLLYLILLCCLTSCSRRADSTTKHTLETPAAKYHIGLCQTSAETNDPALTEGFQAALDTKIKDAQIIYSTKNMDSDTEILTNLFPEIEQGGLDLLFVADTENTIQNGTAGYSVPVIAPPAYDATEQAAEVLLQLMPDIQQLGILYHSADASAKAKTKKLTQYLDQKKIPYQKYPFINATSFAAGANDICDQCDAAYIPSDPAAVSQASQLEEIFLPAGIPLVSDHHALQNSSIATAGIHYYDLGYRLGEIVADFLQNGKQPDLSMIQMTDYINIIYNHQLCEEFDLPVPTEPFSDLP